MAKISEYCRKKNKEIEKITNERDTVLQQKTEVMKQLDKYVIDSNYRQNLLLSKFSLLLNEKKKKIEKLV